MNLERWEKQITTLEDEWKTVLVANMKKLVLHVISMHVYKTFLPTKTLPWKIGMFPGRYDIISFGCTYIQKGGGRWAWDHSDGEARRDGGFGWVSSIFPFKLFPFHASRLSLHLSPKQLWCLTLGGHRHAHSLNITYIILIIYQLSF